MILFMKSTFVYLALRSYFSRDSSVRLLFDETRFPILLTIFPEAEFLFLSLFSF